MLHSYLLLPNDQVLEVATGKRLDKAKLNPARLNEIYAQIDPYTHVENKNSVASALECPFIDQMAIRDYSEYYGSAFGKLESENPAYLRGEIALRRDRNPRFMSNPSMVSGTYEASFIAILRVRVNEIESGAVKFNKDTWINKWKAERLEANGEFTKLDVIAVTADDVLKLSGTSSEDIEFWTAITTMWDEEIEGVRARVGVRSGLQAQIHGQSFNPNSLMVPRLYLLAMSMSPVMFGDLLMSHKISGSSSVIGILLIALAVAPPVVSLMNAVDFVNGEAESSSLTLFNKVGGAVGGALFYLWGIYKSLA